MRIESVNVGARTMLTAPGFEVATGIFKRPIAGLVPVGAGGVGGDAIINTRHHGGPDQAVYVYRQEDYEWWSQELGATLAPGTFGENLTVSGLASPEMVIGSRMMFDTVLLEVTAPRIPCRTLQERMKDERFIKRFIAAERPGIYCRVITGGAFERGEQFSVVPFAGEAVSTLEIFRAAYRKLSRAEVNRFLAAPIDVRTRAKFEQQLSR